MKVSVVRGLAAGSGLILLAGCETTSTTTADRLKTDTTATNTPAKVDTAALEVASYRDGGRRTRDRDASVV